MSRALRELGLGPDADERAIKRAYAARLKTTRPDTDPESFQRLNAAYQAALAWVQSRANDSAAPLQTASATDTETDPSTDEVPSGAITQVLSADALFAMLASQPVEADDGTHDDARSGTFELAHSDTLNADRSTEASSTETIHFDLDAFFHDCVAVAAHGRDGELLDWLNAQPILWSLQHKAQIAEWLLGYLHEHRPAIEARRFDVLADFFGLVDIHSGYDAYVIQRLRHRMHLGWEIQTGQIQALAQHSSQDGGSNASNYRQTRRILDQLSRPFRWPQAVFAALIPNYPTAVRNLLRRLDFGHLDDLPPPIRPEQAAFWDAAGDRSHFSKPRWAVSVARLFAYTGVVTLAYGVLSPLAQPGSAYEKLRFADIASQSFATMSILWLGHLAYDSFIRWQALPESASVRFPRLRTLSIPILAMATMTIGLWFQLDGSDIVMASVVLVLALQRYRRRNGLPLNAKIPLSAMEALCVLIGLFALIIVCASGYVAQGIAGVALVLWALDLRKQRTASGN